MWFSGMASGNYAVGYAAVCPPIPVDNPPVAVVDPPGAEGKVGASFTVDGIGSYDPDGDEIIGYSWTIASRPPGSTFPLPPNTGPEFSFMPDAEGDYQVCLRAASRNAAAETVWSDPVCVAVRVRGYAYCDCPEAALTVKRLEDRSWHMRYRVARLSWIPSRPNAACLTGGFRIYRLQGAAWTPLADVGPEAATYDDRGVADWYEYKVVPLREDGRECLGRMYDAVTRGSRWRR
jgi:hypothetical protein